MIFKLNRKVEKCERNDEMTRKSKSKALFGINLNAQHDLFWFGKIHVRLLDTLVLSDVVST